MRCFNWGRSESERLATAAHWFRASRQLSELPSYVGARGAQRGPALTYSAGTQLHNSGTHVGCLSLTPMQIVRSPAAKHFCTFQHTSCAVSAICILSFGLIVGLWTQPRLLQNQQTQVGPGRIAHKFQRKSRMVFRCCVVLRLCMHLVQNKWCICQCITQWHFTTVVD